MFRIAPFGIRQARRTHISAPLTKGVGLATDHKLRVQTDTNGIIVVNSKTLNSF